MVVVGIERGVGVDRGDVAAVAVEMGRWWLS